MESKIKVAELFAGVGGFRLALEGYASPTDESLSLEPAGPFKTIWANQWEPPGTASKQFAARCYESHFGKDSVVNEDINRVLNEYEEGLRAIPDVQMVVGGFPCQDYSVAKPLSSSKGIRGIKGVLWWDIYRFLELKSPALVLLENVDRLLSSPATQRGRDFSIMLSCFYRLGYHVEWAIINSGAYGFPQRRKRTYIFAYKPNGRYPSISPDILSTAFPFVEEGNARTFHIGKDPYKISKTYTNSRGSSPYASHGTMVDGEVYTTQILETYRGKEGSLRQVLVPESAIPPSYYLKSAELEKWQYLKGAKREKRINKQTGFEYSYSEGAMSFPDSLDKPSRTILTGEGGAGASRFKHVVKPAKHYRRLVPEELEGLQGFPKGWTDTGMSDGQRAFCMGNALVVGIPHRIGKEIARRINGVYSLLNQ